MIYRKCVFAGTFDPITKGHEEVIKASSKMFDEVTVALLINNSKNCLYSLETRKSFVEKVCEKYSNVTVKSFDGLLVDFLKSEGTEVYVRGVRNCTDFEYETDAYNFNSDMDKDIITVYIPCKKDFAPISSTRVRELIKLGKDVSLYVPVEILPLLQSEK